MYINIVFVLLYRERYRVESFNNTVIYEPEVITENKHEVQYRTFSNHNLVPKSGSLSCTVVRTGSEALNFHSNYGIL